MGYKIELCDNQKFVCFTKQSDTIRLQIFMMINVDTYVTWFETNQTKEIYRQMKAIEESHPGMIKAGKQLGSNIGMISDGADDDQNSDKV